MRIFKTLGAVLLVCAAYGLLGGRNPCFACIGAVFGLSLIHISEPTRQEAISYAVFCLKKRFF